MKQLSDSSCVDLSDSLICDWVPAKGAGVHKSSLYVSSGILAFYGPGAIPSRDVPPAAVGLSFSLAGATISLNSDAQLARKDTGAELAFFMNAGAWLRIAGGDPAEAAIWHLPSDLRTIALAFIEARFDPALLDTFRLAKGLELLCATFQKTRDGNLIAAGGAAMLPEIDAGRLVKARCLIEERWGEKLSLNAIARECGLSRAKLTRGFRSMFGCSVAEALAERRMSVARDMLLATQLPVSSIGYRCGYVSNASFTRAFSRRFGLAPTRLRADRIAA